MSPSLLQNHVRGVLDVDLDNVAGQQLPGRSIGRHSSRLDILDGLRNIRRHYGKGSMHLRCSSHCIYVSPKLEIDSVPHDSS